MHRPRIRSVAAAAAGALAGVAVAAAALAHAPARAAGLDGDPPPAKPYVDGAHVPPALTRPGEAVVLRYAIVCAPRADGGPCDGSGEIHIRRGQSGTFDTIPLVRGNDSKDGRYEVKVPQALASAPDGFSYYAVLRDDATGASMTLPPGGADAPQRSLPLREPAFVHLGRTGFASTAAAGTRVFAAAWGSDRDQLGLAGSKELGFVGPASFDVLPTGEVVVLDQVNRRVVRWSDGRVAAATPIDVSGTVADLAADAGGGLYVLESPTRDVPQPRLEAFTSAGQRRWSQPLAERTWSKLAHGPRGPLVQAQPAEQWLPLAEDGAPVPAVAQARRAEVGRALGLGRELVADRVRTSELRVAETAGHAVRRSWIVTSELPLGEVQLAEPYAGGAVVVVRRYTDAADDFVALVLGPSGAARQISIESADWAEAAPLARFRLAGSALYRLGSSPAGAFVDRFLLEAAR
jgi:hypothetical protein